MSTARASNRPSMRNSRVVPAQSASESAVLPAPVARRPRFGNERPGPAPSMRSGGPTGPTRENSDGGASTSIESHDIEAAPLRAASSTEPVVMRRRRKDSLPEDAIVSDQIAHLKQKKAAQLREELLASLFDLLDLDDDSRITLVEFQFAVHALRQGLTAKSQDTSPEEDELRLKMKLLARVLEDQLLNDFPRRGLFVRAKHARMRTARATDCMCMCGCACFWLRLFPAVRRIQGRVQPRRKHRAALVARGPVRADARVALGLWAAVPAQGAAAHFSAATTAVHSHCVVVGHE